MFGIQAAEAKNITPLVATFKNGHYEVRKSFFYNQCVCVCVILLGCLLNTLIVCLCIHTLRIHYTLHFRIHALVYVLVYIIICRLSSGY